MSVLRQKKLKIRSQGPSGRVMVFQDGDAADGDVTSGYRFDDAFVDGAQRPSTTAAADRELVDVVSLRCDLDRGSELKLRITGARSWADGSSGAIRINPNDRVEFFAEVPDELAVSLASWHLNEQTAGTQVRLLKGFVDSVNPGNDGAVEVVVMDALAKANDVKVVRQPGTVDVPKLALNQATDSADWYWMPKAGTVAAPTTWTYGETDLRDHRMTVKQILEYLADEYQTTLQTEDVLDAGADLWDATDIANLSTRPPAMTLENVGFADAVRQILRWVPDRRLVVDQRTSTWRIIPWGVALGVGTAYLRQQLPPSGGATTIRLPMSAASLFTATPGVDGNRIHIYDGDDPSKHEEAYITAKNTSGPLGSELQLTLDRELSRYYSSFYLGSVNYSRISPVLAETLPTLTLSIDACAPGGVKLSKDLKDAYSAVQIWSVHQKTETISALWYEDLTGPRLKPAWNRAYEADWNDKDAEREADLGLNGIGARFYKIDNDGSHDRVYLSFAESQWGVRHTDDEWKHCTFRVMTSNGTDVSGNDYVFRILAQVRVADVGDGSAGLRITLDTTVGGLLALVTTFKTLDGAGPTYDFAQLTKDHRWSTTTGDNERWGVGRKWYIDETDHLQNATSGLHSETCKPVKVTVDYGVGTSARTLALDSQRGFPSTNWNPSGAFEYVGGGGVGTTLIWRRRSFYLDKPAGSCPSGNGWVAPKSVEATIERTTTDVRVARYPAGSDHAGHAREAFNLVRTLDIPTDLWIDDYQTPDYEALAQRLWNAYQQAHQRGTVTLSGIREWAAFLDLSMRVTLTTAIGPVDETTNVNGFWGVVTGCEIDFTAETVTIEFDNKALISNLASDILEQLTVKAKPQAAQSAIMAAAAKQLADCLASLRTDTQPSYVCGARTYEPGSGRPIPPVIKIPGKDNVLHGAVPISTGVSEANATGDSLEGSATHGPGATQTVFEDFQAESGAAYRIGGVGEIVPGTRSGANFTDAATPIAGPRGLAHAARDDAQALAAMALGITLAREQQPPIYARTDAGSTTSTIVVKAPMLPDVSTPGWRVAVLDWKDRMPRALYDVDSITGGTDIALTTAITDDAGAPDEDKLVIVLPPRPETPDPGDFATGSVGFQQSGDWFVWEPTGGAGTVWYATLSGTTLSKDTSGSHALALGTGPTAGTGVSLTTPSGSSGPGMVEIAVFGS